MPNHRSRAQHDRAKWRLLILAPAWALQLIINLGMMGLFSWRLNDTVKNFDDRHKSEDPPEIDVAWNAVNAALSLVSAVCTLVEIGRYTTDSLTPWTVLFSQIIKLACAVGILALDLVVLLGRHDTRYSVISLGLDAALMVMSIGFAIYAVLVYRRLSQYGDHDGSANVKGYGFNDAVGQDTSYASTLSFDPSRDRRLSSTSRHGSRSTSHPPIPLQENGRVQSYSHERDTQFDEYVARRQSFNAPAGDIDKAVDQELGWTARPGDAPEDPVISSGTVAARPSVSNAPRAASWASDHALVSYPGEEDAAAAGHNEDEERDREALLGGEPRDSDDGPQVPQEVDSFQPKWKQDK